MTTVFDKAAQNLCKRAVTIRLQMPVWALASGAAYKTRTGAAIIDINPGCSSILGTFLHEAAHVRCQFDRMTPSDAWKAAPGSLPRGTSAGGGLKVSSGAESEADKWRSTWESYCFRYSWRYQGESELARKLACLAEWPKLDVQEALELAEYNRQLEAAKRAAAHMAR